MLRLTALLSPLRTIVLTPIRALAGSAPSYGIGSPLPRAPEHGECIYLDYQATTPVWPEVAAAAEPFLRYHWGNPSSGHAFARPCATEVARARKSVAALIGCSDDEVLFTGCGSEADNHAVIGALEAEEARRRQAGAAATRALPHFVTSNIEHPAIIECLESLRQAGRLEVSYVAADREGRVSEADVVAALTPETVLVSIMHSNNEVGSVQPIEAITSAVRAARPSVLVHTDAAQSIGKLSVDVEALGVDMLTLVGHKFGAPKGVAALYIRRGLPLPKLLHGGGQEGGRRAGTESVVLLAALGEASRIARAEGAALRAHMQSTRDLLSKLLVDGLPYGATRLNGPADATCAARRRPHFPLLCDCAGCRGPHPRTRPRAHRHRLPNTLSIGLRDVKASVLLARLGDQLAASAGAACHTQTASVSAVLKAMDVPLEYAIGTLRLSTGRHTTEDEVRRAAALIIAEAERQWAEERGEVAVEGAL